MNTNFFDSNSYFIDEKVNLFQFENCYKVFNDKGAETGSIRQKLTTGQKILRLLVNKAMLPFILEIKDSDEKVLATVSRGWTFILSKIIISDTEGKAIASIRQKFKLFKPTFNIFDNSEQIIAKITGDWKAWEFVIKDSSDRQIGTISKKWAGAMKEIFTTADKYNVNIDPAFKNDSSKIAVIASAITIDMVLKESK